MYKLNLTEVELRKKTVDETKDHVVHTKNNVVIDNNVKDNSKKESYEKSKVVEKKSQRYITVDAVKSEKMQIKAKRDSDFAGEEIIGTFIDKLK